MRTWIKDPLAIFADGAERGLVVEGTRIAERVGQGEAPEHIDATFDASRHVVLPGLVNTHHHFYQTLTRAHPSAELWPKVGESVNRGRRHIVGVFEPPLLHRRSDMPCSMITLSNLFSQGF
jgi:cytosine/adenosine deaminase-related metal-dependent hydrolase